MKIVVEEMPKTSQECPFSEFRNCKSNQKGWYGCRKGQIVCNLEKGCPFFIGINQLKKGGD